MFYFVVYNDAYSSMIVIGSVLSNLILATDSEGKWFMSVMGNHCHTWTSPKPRGRRRQGKWFVCYRKPLSHQPVNKCCMDTAIRKQTHVTNKTSALLQTTGGNGELNIVLSSVPIVASVSGLSILDCPFGFLYCVIMLQLNKVHFTNQDHYILQFILIKKYVLLCCI
jgi:hypothetical protein